MDELSNLIKKHKVLIFSTSDCKDTEEVENIFRSYNVTFKTILLDSVTNREKLEKELYSKSSTKITPTVFVNGYQITGKQTIRRYLEDGTLGHMLDGSYQDSDYDLLVIGGGSGGIAAAREAGKLGASVCLCDFVDPTPHGTTWGLGGTCVNVGCVPKKLMHMAAIIGSDLQQAAYYGWNMGSKPFHNWNTLVAEVQNHVKALNFGYRKTLRENGVVYKNAKVKFQDARTVKTLDRRGEEATIKAKEFIIATGGRPTYMEIPGAEHAITSDDVFSLPYHPGKIIIVGASYVALECAGFLNAFGVDTTVCARKKVLSKYDQQMAALIEKHMSHLGVKFMRDTVLDSITKIKSGEPGTYEVNLKIKGDKVVKQEYNTILFAIGRKPNTADLGLDKAGVKINPDTGYILVNEKDQTSAAHIYAVGDVCEDRSQLTPVAVQTGKNLARRLYGNEDTLTDHSFIPSTVFAPLEYGFIGLTEEEAVKKYGQGDVNVCHINYVPPGYCLAPRIETCYGKIVSVISDNERVVGFHVCGPNAGEITQGFALPLKMRATRKDFLNLFPVHHTSASVFADVCGAGKDLNPAKEPKPSSSKTNE